mmetsp:Transcript_45863/g.143900  ORF Transcript_45863/g.143900 Transcript_45863/m.143900 type:complete len:246 (-) Transcript_45863:921-1658(-)
MRGCWTISSVLVVLVAVFLPRIYKIHVERNLSYPTDSIFGWFAVQTMVQYNSPGVLDAIEKLALKENSTLLELCIGPGYGVQEALRYKGVKVIGVDVSPDMVKMASEAVQGAIDEGRASVVLGDARNLTFLGDEQVDKVFHMNCCYFWDNVEDTLKEILRVMKPGGVMLSGVKFEQLQQWDAHPAFFKMRDEKIFLKALKAVGFKKITVKKVRLGSSCTGTKAMSGCPVHEGMHYTAIFAEKPER